MFQPSIIAHQMCLKLQDCENNKRYCELATEISECKEDDTVYTLTRGENGLMLSDIPESFDVFKTMTLETLANIDSGDCTLSLKDAIFLLEEYTFFKF